MNEKIYSEDYLQGFKDGFKAAVDALQGAKEQDGYDRPPKRGAGTGEPLAPVPVKNIVGDWHFCSVCERQLDSIGNYYCCMRPNCPTH